MESKWSNWLKKNSLTQNPGLHNAGFFFVRFSGGWKCQKPPDYWVFEQFPWVFWRFSWVFGQNCWVFVEFSVKIYVYHRKITKFWLYLQFCVALLPWKVKFLWFKTQLLCFCDRSLSFSKKICVKPPEHWVLHLKTLEFFSSAWVFFALSFCENAQKKPVLNPI